LHRLQLDVGLPRDHTSGAWFMATSCRIPLVIGILSAKLAAQ
jgi:hypothetical protein